MSEQTPENMSEREPSMEDILASIRKIIAEDAPAQTGGLPAASELGMGDSIDALVPAAASLATPAPQIDPEPFDLTTLNEVEIDSSSSDELLDMVEFDLTDDLAMGNEDIDLLSAAPMSAPEDALDGALASISGAHDDTLELTEFAEIETTSEGLDVDSLLTEIETPVDAGEVTAAVTKAAPSDITLNDLDLSTGEDITSSLNMDEDLDELLDGLVSDAQPVDAVEDVALDVVPEVETVIDPAADMIADEDSEDILESLGFNDLETENLEVSAVSQDDDIDLVKSLMADLTGESDTNFENDDLIDAIIEEQSSDLAGVTATADEASSDEADDLSSIIADLTADSQDAEARAQSIREADVLDNVGASEDTGSTSLGALAAAATAGVAAVGVAGLNADKPDEIDEMFDMDTDLEALLEDSDAAGAPIEDALIEETKQEEALAASPEPVESDNVDINEQQESDMSATKGREAISSRDTVDDTSSAFASLGKVVEEKAVFQESGPRIGDLVQDALKPMLQEWLDANLKQIVDRAVAKEIKRISSGK